MPFLTLITTNWKLIVLGLIIAFIGTQQLVIKHKNSEITSLKKDVAAKELQLLTQNQAIKELENKTKEAIEAGKKAQEEAEVKKQESEELKRKLRSFPNTGKELEDSKKLLKDYKKGTL